MKSYRYEKLFLEIFRCGVNSSGTFFKQIASRIFSKQNLTIIINDAAEFDGINLWFFPFEICNVFRRTQVYELVYINRKILRVSIENSLMN